MNATGGDGDGGGGGGDGGSGIAWKLPSKDAARSAPAP